MLLRGRTAIVSGIGPGLGQAIARALAREGAAVTVSARRAESVEALARALRESGARAHGVVADVTRDADCERIVEETERTLGPVDVLVNNAYHPGAYVPITEARLDDWRAPFEVNVLGTLRLTRAALARMRPRRTGSIVMVGSMVVRRPLPTMADYASSKAALLVATQTLAREVGADGVRVNSIVPGYIGGPALEGWFASQAPLLGTTPQALHDGVAKEIALGFIPSSEDVAEPVVFFASDLSRAVTGQSLDVNGGHVFH